MVFDYVSAKVDLRQTENIFLQACKEIIHWFSNPHDAEAFVIAILIIVALTKHNILAN